MKKLVILLCLFWMGFIFYMSNYNGEASHESSIKVVNFIENKITNESSNVNKNVVNERIVETNKLDHIIRKNAHAFMYMILAFLVSAILFVFNKKGKDAIVYILFICLFYALTDELHQSFIPARTPSISDVFVDFGGALVGLVLFYITYYKIFDRQSRMKKKI